MAQKPLQKGHQIGDRSNNPSQLREVSFLVDTRDRRGRGREGFRIYFTTVSTSILTGLITREGFGDDPVLAHQSHLVIVLLHFKLLGSEGSSYREDPRVFGTEEVK